MLMIDHGDELELKIKQKIFLQFSLINNYCLSLVKDQIMGLYGSLRS